MAEVWLARDESGQEIALKIPLQQYRHQPHYRQRFLEEVRLTASLHHPNIVPTVAAGELDDGTPYMAMPYLQGQTLADRIANSPISWQEALGISSKILEALDYAHRKGVIHRDLKPRNVFLTSDGQVKVMDFGIARAIGPESLTHSGSFIGTPFYLAPEQALGGIADCRSDLYAVGCLLYEMLAGSPPFQADTPWAVIRQHQETPVNAFRREGLPSGLDKAIRKALAKRPQYRYQSARELLGDLEAIASGRGQAVSRKLRPAVGRFADRYETPGTERARRRGVSRRISGGVLTISLAFLLIHLGTTGRVRMGGVTDWLDGLIANVTSRGPVQARIEVTKVVEVPKYQLPRPESQIDLELLYGTARTAMSQQQWARAALLLIDLHHIAPERDETQKLWTQFLASHQTLSQANSEPFLVTFQGRSQIGLRFTAPSGKIFFLVGHPHLLEDSTEAEPDYDNFVVRYRQSNGEPSRWVFLNLVAFPPNNRDIQKHPDALPWLVQTASDRPNSPLNRTISFKSGAGTTVAFATPFIHLAPGAVVEVRWNAEAARYEILDSSGRILRRIGIFDPGAPPMELSFGERGASFYEIRAGDIPGDPRRIPIPFDITRGGSVRISGPPYGDRTYACLRDMPIGMELFTPMPGYISAGGGGFWDGSTSYENRDVSVSSWPQGEEPDVTDWSIDLEFSAMNELMRYDSRFFRSAGTSILQVSPETKPLPFFENVSCQVAIYVGYPDLTGTYIYRERFVPEFLRDESGRFAYISSTRQP